ncbi:hypothetical protein FJTKL_05625 [Diaporthe vaccinii]|uniref:Uncharacterized protein n=1 Tax=Diaporthe vaccinii TaxID=105482 RepID=A0ABR4DRJ2_9PEZI
MSMKRHAASSSSPLHRTCIEKHTPGWKSCRHPSIFPSAAPSSPMFPFFPTAVHVSITFVIVFGCSGDWIPILQLFACSKLAHRQAGMTV